MCLRLSLRPGISWSTNTRENLRPTVHYPFSTTDMYLPQKTRDDILQGVLLTLVFVMGMLGGTSY